MNALPRKFYVNDTKQVAKDLLGKKLVRKIGSSILSGVIVHMFTSHMVCIIVSMLLQKKRVINLVLF